MQKQAFHSVAQAQHLLETLAKLIVNDESDVRVEVMTNESETILRLRVSDSDVGKIIGSNGHTARSLRNVFEAIGIAQGTRYSLEIERARI